MAVIAEKQTLSKAKPFLKWAGGKTQLLPEIESRLPESIKTGEIDTYAEPFVGGGAVFFHIAQRYESIKHFYLFDINKDLVNCYNTIKSDVDSLIENFKTLEKKFYARKRPQQKDYYYQIRDQFNSDRSTAKLIFLNKTCYNGLYRVNSKGEFNVPFGDYKKPTICNEDNLRAVSGILQSAEIICGDFEISKEYITKKTFIYIDPPYRPLSPTASFTSYSKENFANEDQIRLSEFCKQIDDKGAKFLLSNSDPQNEVPTDRFFEEHYEEFTIDRVKAARAINCKATGRGKIHELIVSNY